MRNLIINRIQYSIETVGSKRYGADVPFEMGLNIIYGPNSVGKSSLVTGIIYCLGAEKSLGIFQNKQNPFKPEFYDKINNEKITKSFIKLEISNGKDVVTLMRSIINKTDVVGLKRCSIGQIEATPETRYLIAAGEGVFGSEGLQTFLFEFLGWDIVEIPTYDAGLSKLYFENLTSLFFIEQRAGWFQIQARQVMRYGIREVKKVAFEYLMGLDRFDTHIKEIERRNIQEKILRGKRELKEREEDILVLINGSIDDKDLMVTRRGTGRLTIQNAIKALKEKYKEDTDLLNALTTKSEDSGTQENFLRSNLRIVTHQIRKSSERINLLIQEITSYENYIDRININRNKNRQLKKIEGISPELNISTCPVCETVLLDHDEGSCKLCHQDLKRKISTPDENLEFLEDEKSSFEKILTSKRLDLKKAKHRFQELKLKEKTIVESLDHQINTYIGPQLENYRQKAIELDMLFKEIELHERTYEKWKKLEALRKEIADLEKEDEGLKETIRKYQHSKNDEAILSKLTAIFKETVKKLRLLKGKDDLISSIKIDDKDFYSPYLEEYDLYNISSSSDNVRIILSYYLALLQTSIESHSPKIRFPNLLILDEPKQQNLDNIDLNNFIDILEHLPNDTCQVILTTFSETSKNKNLFKQFIRLEMVNETDYLIKEIKLLPPADNLTNG
jgi:hypothetical protein